MPVEDSSILNEHQRGWERIMRNVPKSSAEMVWCAA
jgi:hypothetical protein